MLETEIESIANEVLTELLGEKQTIEPLNAALGLIYIHHMHRVTTMSLQAVEQIMALGELASKLPSSQIPRLCEIAGWMTSPARDDYRP